MQGDGNRHSGAKIGPAVRGLQDGPLPRGDLL